MDRADGHGRSGDGPALFARRLCPLSPALEIMTPLASGISYFDLEFQDTPHVIATVLLMGQSGIALIDPRPSSPLPRLEAALREAGLLVSDLSALLLTHVHLDHAGAAGSLVAKNPRLKVYVHEKGAPHMINPEKLLASATRLYG